jgi:hypothetical protein
MYCFDTRTGQVCIDYAKCSDCVTMACVDACREHGVAILAEEAGRPLLNVSPEEARRRDSECLACEIACRQFGRQAITIHLPIAGLEEYREKHGYSAD